MNILTVNAGSSSIKCALFQAASRNTEVVREPLWEGSLEWGRKTDVIELTITTKSAEQKSQEIFQSSREASLLTLLKTIWEGEDKVISGPEDISIVGHRVVHGGEEFSKPSWITTREKETIKGLSNLAPLHNPANAEGVEILEKLLPRARQAAIFDTTFHLTIPDHVSTYPGPYKWREMRIRRYGFHGISHQYCAEQAAKLLNRPLNELTLLSCHLGNGCSLTAVENGKSVDTTMGFTPLEGLMMGTRSGSVDPAILLYLMRHNKMDADALEHLLFFESGLKGISEKSSDMREILALVDKGDPKAALAFKMFIYRLRAQIGALLANIKPLNAIIFTAGIGENSAKVREAACWGLERFGIVLDKNKNSNCQPDQDISAADSLVRILTIHTREEWQIATICLQISDE